MKWIELEVNVPPSESGSISNRLFELGATSLAERESVPAGGDVTLTAAFSDSQRGEVEKEISAYFNSLVEMKALTKPIALNWKIPSDIKWEDQYKRYYFAQRLNRTFFLRPTWDKETRVPEEMIKIEMDPGEAFGTGLHATTRVTMTAIEDCLKYFLVSHDVSFLDVGTGSGILSIAAFKLGVRNITAVDNDPVALVVAKQNCELNDCPEIKIQVNPLEDLQGTFLLIASNILLETHRQLFAEYRRVADEKGFLILSGVLVPQRAELVAIAEEHGFKEIAYVAQQEWLASIFTRGNQLGIR